MERQFDDLLMFGKHLGRPLLMFRPENIGQPLDYFYQSASNQTKARVVVVMMRTDEPERVSYVRHHAFHPKFERIDEDWYLIVEPTYFFTYDGFRWHQHAEALLSGKKKLEKNSALWGQVIMWQSLLCSRSPHVPADLFAKSVVSDRTAIEFELASVVHLPVATPEAAWRRSDPYQSLTENSDQLELPL